MTLAVASAGNIITRGESNSAFGKYTIEKLDDHMIVDNRELDQYMITYDKSDLKVLVVMEKQKKCKKYFVLTDKMPVQYECNGTYFGIKKLEKAMAERGYSASTAKMNREEFFHQRVLTSETTATVDHLSLIASYYPGLFAEKVS